MLLGRNNGGYYLDNNNAVIEYNSNVRKEQLRLLSPEGQLEVLQQDREILELTNLERMVMIEVAVESLDSKIVKDSSFWKRVSSSLNSKVEKKYSSAFWELTYRHGSKTYRDLVLSGQINSEVFMELFMQYSNKLREIEHSKTEQCIKLENSIEELKIYSYEELEMLCGKNFALKLRDQAHAKGICLKGDIPEDLIPLEVFRNNGLTVRTCNCFVRNNVNSVGDVITYADEETAREKLTRLRGFGEGCWDDLVRFMNDAGYTFASREVKVEEYQKRLGNVK